MRALPPLLWCLPLLAGSAGARPPVIDVHTHVRPDRYNLATDALASAGITRFINLSGGQPGRGLEEHLERASLYEDRVLVCANPNWRGVGDADFGAREAAALETAARLGARCLKISKALGLGVPDPDDPKRYLAVDDPRLDPLWAAAGRLGLPVFIHTGDPKAFFEPMGPQNERMAELGVHPEWSFADPSFPRREVLLAQRDRLLARHRGTTFVGVHFANNPEDLTYVEQALDAHPNLYVDLAARVPELGRHPPARLRALFVKHQDRILFGTDLGLTGGLMLGSVGRNQPGLPDLFLYYFDQFRWLETDGQGLPTPTPIQGDWRIDGVQLPAQVLEKVYCLNALKLFWNEAKPDDRDWDAIEAAPGMVSFF
ncbi:MAG: amidohydrolase family protein [Myxococcales bacterium]|nr:amidohydrolase family protein [Myxococcales bacterium]MCB9524334.1 amidohydrolase family protein [Myxococcales bacterium]